MPTLQLKGVSKTYPGQVPVEALIDVDLRIEQGEYVAIEGPSGSGKSTLLNQLALMDMPTTGEYLIASEATSGLSDAARARLRSATFAFIFQSFHLLAGRTVQDNVALGSLYRALPASRRRALATEALRFVDLEDKSQQPSENLSGGQRQRVAIARAIASATPVVLADEPTGNLDSASGAQVMDTLERLHHQGATIIVVTHDPLVAARAERRLHVLDGQVHDESHPPVMESESSNDAPPPFHSEHAPAPPSSMTTTHSPPAAQTSAPTTTPPADAPPPEGRDSRVRPGDALADAWRGLWTKKSRTLALIGSVALGVALSLGTIGLSQTASSQVSDIFDAQRNTRVAMTSPTLEAGTPIATQAASEDSLTRLRAIAGVDDAAVFLTHDPVAVTTTPAGTASDPRPDLVGTIGGSVPTGLLTVDTQGRPVTHLGADEVLVGAQAASAMELGPLLASPVIWIDGQPKLVVGVLTDAGLQVSLLSSVIAPETTAQQFSAASYGTAEIRVAPGAAQQVAAQAPPAWIPADQGSITVDAPPDPTSLRDQIESNLNTMLLTLTGVALLAAVLSLTNSMTTAVFQRTGEFGLRRAIGARRLHITQLVLTESVVIGVIGGITGSYVSVLGILAVTLARHWQPVLDLTTVPLGILGGTLVGLVGGLVAARRASRIQPSDALKAT